jgi:5-formyltetrahydrofolate cyclo-ligase
MDKEQLRQQLLKKLIELSEKQRNQKSRKACQNLVSTPQFQQASVVMMFLSLPQEVDTSDAILQAWQQGKTVVVPRISWQQRHMIAVQINSFDTGFSTSASGMRNPISGAPVPFEEIDLVVAPLGRGGSYYDRFLANRQLRAVKCGFAFAEQLIESVPVTENDVPVDLLVTDEEIINITRDA